eukprot:TRINITY_DN31728_c0_g1_i1.p1 TRINITY_DN31728_c0_g1~~TRINITY_DN31728_c0_g1_i1.p1  ORF type:complete len:447 (+),score=95.05 TRINITY_DN31728_c0_g1_i1:125-1465(+)
MTVKEPMPCRAIYHPAARPRFAAQRQSQTPEWLVSEEEALAATRRAIQRDEALRKTEAENEKMRRRREAAAIRGRRAAGEKALAAKGYAEATATAEEAALRRGWTGHNYSTVMRSHAEHAATKERNRFYDDSACAEGTPVHVEIFLPKPRQPRRPPLHASLTKSEEDSESGGELPAPRHAEPGQRREEEEADQREERSTTRPAQPQGQAAAMLQKGATALNAKQMNPLQLEIVQRILDERERAVRAELALERELADEAAGVVSAAVPSHRSAEPLTPAPELRLQFMRAILDERERALRAELALERELADDADGLASAEVPSPRRTPRPTPDAKVLPPGSSQASTASRRSSTQAASDAEPAHEYTFAERPSTSSIGSTPAPEPNGTPSNHASTAFASQAGESCAWVVDVGQLRSSKAKKSKKKVATPRSASSARREPSSGQTPRHWR